MRINRQQLREKKISSAHKRAKSGSKLTTPKYHRGNTMKNGQMVRFPENPISSRKLITSDHSEDDQRI